jgi:hypothetical protein
MLPSAFYFSGAPRRPHIVGVSWKFQQSLARSGLDLTPAKTNLIEALNLWTESLSHGLPVNVVFIFSHLLIRFPMNAFSCNWTDVIRSNTELDQGLPTRQNSDSVCQWRVLHYSSCAQWGPPGVCSGPALFLIFVADASSMMKSLPLELPFASRCRKPS